MTLKYSLLVCLLAGAAQCIEQKSNNNFSIAPDKSTDDTFVVVQYREITNKIPRKLSIQLRVYDQRTEIYRECSLNLTTRQAATKSGVSTLRRLTGDKVILAWYDELPNGLDRRTRIVAMSDDCRRINPVLDNLPGDDPIILPSVAGKFDVIANDEVSCRAVGKRCRIGYNLGLVNDRGSSTVGRVWPLSVDLDWSSLRMQRLRNGDYLARGYDGTTYRVLRVNGLTGANETLLVQFEANPQPEFATTDDLAICGIVYPGYDNFTQCARYNETNELVFQKRVWFDEPMTLMDLRVLDDARMFLLVGKSRCASEFDCWKLYGVEVRDGEARMRRPSFSHFTCTGDRRALRIFDVAMTADRFAVGYVCKNDEEFNYNVAYFDVDDEDV